MSSASAARMRAIAAGISDPQSGSCAIPNPVRRDSSVIVTSKVTAVPPTCPSSILSAFFASSRSPSTRRCASGRRSAVAGSTSGSSGVVSSDRLMAVFASIAVLRNPSVRASMSITHRNSPFFNTLRVTVCVGAGSSGSRCAAVRVRVLGDLLQVRQEGVDVPPLGGEVEDLPLQVVLLVRRQTRRRFSESPPHRRGDLRVQEPVAERGGDLREPRRQRLTGERVLPGPERVPGRDHRPRHRP